MVQASDPSNRLCVGQFAGAHGVRGLVRFHSYTGVPKDVLRYQPLQDEQGQAFRLAPGGQAPKGSKGDVLVVRVVGVEDRDAAQALSGRRLYVDRAILPALHDDDDFYHADLIGCACITEAGDRLGHVRAIHDFGAGDVLEVIGGPKGSVYLPFTKAVVPHVSIADRCLTVRLPEEVMGEPGRGGDDKGDADAGADSGEAA